MLVKSYARFVFKRHHSNNDIVIPNVVVTSTLCNKLVHCEPSLIRYIPPHLHTDQMYESIYNKNKYVFLHFQMKDDLQSTYLDKLVNDGDIRYYQQSENNKNNYSIDNYVTEVTRWPYYLKHVPLDKQAEVFEKLPPDFFTHHTMDQLCDCVISFDLYQQYFSKIQLYRIVDMNNKLIDRFYVDKHAVTTWNNLPHDYLVWHVDLFLDLIHRHRDYVHITPVDVKQIHDKQVVKFSSFHCLTME